MVFPVPAPPSTNTDFLFSERSASIISIKFFLFKLMLTSDEDFNYREFGEDEKDFVDKVKQ